MGVSQWRYGTVGFLAGVNPLRHTHTKQIASPRKVTQVKMSTFQSRASRTSFYWNMALRHSTFRRNFLPLRFQASSRGVVEAFALLEQCEGVGLSVGCRYFRKTCPNLTLNMKPPHSFETSATAYPTTQRHRLEKRTDVRVTDLSIVQ